MFNQQDSNTIEDAQGQLVTDLVATESQRELELIERKLQVLRRLKD
jgi:hypothetical protein